MALDIDILTKGLTDMITNGYPTVEESVEKWADIYYNYSKGAEVVAWTAYPTPADLTNQKKLLKDTLTGIFNTNPGLAATTAPLIGAAFASFWMSPPVTFNSLPTICVTGTSGVVILQTSLSNILAIPSKEIDPKVNAIAAAIDVFTKTVLVINSSLIPPVILPIT